MLIVVSPNSKSAKAYCAVNNKITEKLKKKSFIRKSIKHFMEQVKAYQLNKTSLWNVLEGEQKNYICYKITLFNYVI